MRFRPHAYMAPHNQARSLACPKHPGCRCVQDVENVWPPILHVEDVLRSDALGFHGGFLRDEKKPAQGGLGLIDCCGRLGFGVTYGVMNVGVTCIASSVRFKWVRLTLCS